MSSSSIRCESETGDALVTCPWYSMLNEEDIEAELGLSFCSAKKAEEKIRYAIYNCIAIDTDTNAWEE